MAQRSLRRDRDNQLINQCREHVCLIWTRSADSHPGPRPVSRMTGRTHGSPDHALHQTRRFLLRLAGRPHMSQTRFLLVYTGELALAGCCKINGLPLPL